jgi:hypothetical protein
VLEETPCDPPVGKKRDRGANEGSEGSFSQTCHLNESEPSFRLLQRGKVPPITKAQNPFRNSVGVKKVDGHGYSC